MLLTTIQDTDSYKLSHWLQFPPGTESTFYYFGARGVDTKAAKYHGLFTEGETPYTVFFGLQYYIDTYLSKPIKLQDVEHAAKMFKLHGVPFNYDGWVSLVRKHAGRLPIRIRAVPEGTSVPIGNALFTVETTDPEFFWVAGYVETLLSRVWYPTTVATISHQIRKVILKYLEKTSDNPTAEINFKLHDFGSRGVSSSESAQVGGAAHLINFMGTDTLAALFMISEVYGEECAGFSIPAAEHSTITSWGRDKEVEAYRNMLVQFAKPGSLVAIVSDSYDLWNAVDNLWGGTLREHVLSSGATVIIRPDSGTPHVIVLETVRRLDEKFGHTVNSKGYKVLNAVRVIQGDGVHKAEITRILEVLETWGYSASNIAFGMGGALLQKMDRDTFKFAYKCSSVTIDGEQRDVYKDPITDSGKRSMKGKLDVINFNGALVTTRVFATETAHPSSALRTVFQDGMINKETFSEIRLRSMV